MVQVEPPTNRSVTGSAVWLSSHWHDDSRLTNGVKHLHEVVALAEHSHTERFVESGW